MDYDDAYANAAYIPEGEAYPDRWAAAAAAFRESLGARAELGIAYGDSDRQAFDLFLPEGQARGTLIFTHGGYWLRFDRSYWSHLAAGALARGWSVAMPSYDLCPDVRIADITRQIAAAVRKVAEMTQGPISLAGHSAGGHLTARMLTQGVLPEAVAARLHAVMPISPVSDLRPLIFTEMNRDFRLDVAAAQAESPACMPKSLPVRCMIWVGAEERPVFLDQARWLSEAWGDDLVIAPHKHHFDVIDPLADPESPMVRLLTA